MERKKEMKQGRKEGKKGKKEKERKRKREKERKKEKERKNNTSQLAALCSCTAQIAKWTSGVVLAPLLTVGVRSE